MNQLVSIIMPVFNGEAFIAEAIESVLAQTYPHWELIVVDDGSVDNTTAIVRGFREPRLRYYYQTNAGRSSASNRGIELAQGEYLLFLDADDWLLPNALHAHLAFLTLHPGFGVSVSDGYFCTDQGEQIVSLSQRRGPVASGDVLARIVVDSGLVGATHSVLVRRQTLQENNLRFDPNLVIGEDWHFWIEVACYTLFGFIDAVTCKYRWYEGNTTLSVTNDYRKKQLWQGRQKVMCASYFDTLPVATRQQFFYQVLIDLLADRPDEQDTVMTSRPFLALPDEVRGQLLRLAASEYLLRGEHLEVARKWLQKAWSLAPLEPKTGLVAALSALNLDLAKLTVKAWRNSHRKEKVPSPFEIARVLKE